VDADQTRAAKSKMMRYKRPALASMGYEKIRWELEEILEACEEVCYYNQERYYSTEDENLLSAFDDDETAEWEFRIGFSELASSAEQLDEAMRNLCRQVDYDDCTVALVGNRYNLVGYDYEEEDY